MGLLRYHLKNFQVNQSKKNGYNNNNNNKNNRENNKNLPLGKFLMNRIKEEIKNGMK